MHCIFLPRLLTGLPDNNKLFFLSQCCYPLIILSLVIYLGKIECTIHAQAKSYYPIEQMSKCHWWSKVFSLIFSWYSLRNYYTIKVRLVLPYMAWERRSKAGRSLSRWVEIIFNVWEDHHTSLVLDTNRMLHIGINSSLNVIHDQNIHSLVNNAKRRRYETSWSLIWKCIGCRRCRWSLIPS